MKKTMLVILAIAGLIFFTGSAGVMSQTAKHEKVVTIKAKAMEKNRGTNPNIKGGIPTIDKEAPAPPDRGGEKIRGSQIDQGCMIKLDNWTGFTIEVYVDGYYKGTVDAFGEAIYHGLSGYTTVYCLTVGRTYYWAAKGDCSDYYIFKLTGETAKKIENQ